MLISNLPISTW